MKILKLKTKEENFNKIKFFIKVLICLLIFMLCFYSDFTKIILSKKETAKANGCNFTFSSNIKMIEEEIILKNEIKKIENQQKQEEINNKNYYKTEKEILSLNLSINEEIPLELIQNSLPDREIKKYIPALYSAAKQYGINEIFLISLAIFEGQWGENPYNQNNLFGWNGGEYSSIEDSIFQISKKIKEKYLSEDGVYFKGYTLESVNFYYNGRKEWLNGMVDTMQTVYSAIDFFE